MPGCQHGFSQRKICVAGFLDQFGFVLCFLLKPPFHLPIIRVMNHAEKNEVCASDRETLRRFKRLAWIALLIGIAAVLVLGGLVYFLSVENGASYTEMIKAHWLTRSNLVPALWISGLFLLSLVALIVSVITIYSSFRVAGPLYRFARNLSVSEKHSIIGIRQGDCLQDVSRQLQSSIHTLETHKRAIHELTEKAEVCLQSGNGNMDADYAVLVKQLKARLAGVQVS